MDTFKSLILPLLKQRRTIDGMDKSSLQPHTLIFIPSYFDYVRLRNLLDSEEVEFSTCSEYSDDRDIATARKSFRRGDSATILVTERYHFFRRMKFWGVHHVVFYGPPRVANSYPEVINWIEEKRLNNGKDTREDGLINSSILMYSKCDCLQIERICGSEGAFSMFI
jgi:U3 small nucleolar RNA-associated protein 25